MIGRTFCSRLSLERGERIFGTASRVDSWILVEDRGSWNDRSLPDGNLPGRVIEHLQQTARIRSRCRPLLIRRGHRETGPLRCFIVDSYESAPQIRALHFEGYEDLFDTDFDEAGVPFADPLFLVCTHGRHDKCCARFGLPVYRALRKIFPHDAWECSHVGGDRFAANLVCMPHGIYYGHLSPEDAVTAAESYLSGSLLLDKYRGRCCYSKISQIGEFFIRAQHGIAGLDALLFRSSKALTDGRWHVRFDHKHSQTSFDAEFQQELSEERGILTCRATEETLIRQFVSFTTSGHHL